MVIAGGSRWGLTDGRWTVDVDDGWGEEGPVVM